jgi:hypothetical protein
MKTTCLVAAMGELAACERKATMRLSSSPWFSRSANCSLIALPWGTTAQALARAIMERACTSHGSSWAQSREKHRRGWKSHAWDVSEWLHKNVDACRPGNPVGSACLKWRICSGGFRASAALRRLCPHSMGDSHSPTPPLSSSSSPTSGRGQ